MIGTDIDIAGTRIVPAKDDSPLIVDTNTVKADEVALQSFQSVSRRRHQIHQLFAAIRVACLRTPFIASQDSGPVSAIIPP